MQRHAAPDPIDSERTARALPSTITLMTIGAGGLGGHGAVRDRPVGRNQAHVLLPRGVQSSVISASRITAASLPPNVEENTVMPAKLYSGGASFISRCIVPVRFVASRM